MRQIKTHYKNVNVVMRHVMRQLPFHYGAISIAVLLTYDDDDEQS